MNFDKIHSVYFVGIGGIGMSSLARYFMDIGKKVYGYDKTPSPITESLENDGIFIHFEDDPKFIPEQINRQNSLIVYTPAIPKENACLNYFKDNNFLIKKRSQLLGDITKDKFTIAVAGTHGKTSTASIIAHLLKNSGIDCYGFIGGICVNYNSNYISPDNKNSKIFVVEADEYDRSFLELSPDVAIITSVDPDHLDIYDNEENLKSGYNDFAKKLKNNAVLSLSSTIKSITKPEQAKTLYSYGLESSNDFYASNIKIINSDYHFDIHTPKGEIKNVNLKVAGEHNVLNTLAAISAVYKIIEDRNKIKEAISTYQGVKRRFEYIIKSKGLVFIDDYAHHPSELKAIITSVKNIFPDKKITGIFQPHLFSRTRDFADAFAKNLSLLDKVILLDIYPAREKPIKAVNSELILNKIEIKNKELLSKTELLEVMKSEENDVVLTLGAGDIDRVVEPLKEILLQRRNN